MRPLLLSLPVIFALVACSAEESTTQPKGVLTEVQTKTLKQAKAVDETLKKAEEDRRKTLEAAEQ